MKTWSMAINEDDGDIESIPATLAKTLMPSKPGAKNPFRETSDKAPGKDSNSTAATLSTPPPQSPYFPYPPHPYPYNPYGGGYAQYPQFPPPLPHYQQPVREATEEPKSSPSHSSPLAPESDSSNDKLAKYVTWLSKIYPTKVEQLAQCLETLKREDIVFGTMADISKALFDVWGISTGLQLMLKSHMSKWERAKTKGRA